MIIMGSFLLVWPNITGSNHHRYSLTKKHKEKSKSHVKFEQCVSPNEVITNAKTLLEYKGSMRIYSEYILTYFNRACKLWSHIKITLWRDPLVKLSVCFGKVTQYIMGYLYLFFSFLLIFSLINGYLIYFISTCKHFLFLSRIWSFKGNKRNEGSIINLAVYRMRQYGDILPHASFKICWAAHFKCQPAYPQISPSTLFW